MGDWLIRNLLYFSWTLLIIGVATYALVKARNEYFRNEIKFEKLKELRNLALESGDKELAQKIEREILRKKYPEPPKPTKAEEDRKEAKRQRKLKRLSELKELYDKGELECDYKEGIERFSFEALDKKEVHKRIDDTFDASRDR